MTQDPVLDIVNQAISAPIGDQKGGDTTAPVPNQGQQPAPAGTDPILDVVHSAIGAPLSSNGDAQGERPVGRAPIKPSEQIPDIINSAGTGIEKGAIGMATLPVGLGDWLHERFSKNVTDPLFNWMSGPAPAAPPRQINTLHDIATNTGDYIGNAAVTKGIESIAGPMYKPKSTLGDVAQTVGEFVPTAGKNLITGALLPGTASEIAGQVAHSALPSAEPAARMLGAITGAGLGSALDTAGRSVKGYFGSAPDLDAASAAARQGIDLPKLAVTNNPVIQGAGSALKQLPIGGTPIRQGAEKAIQQISDAKDAAAALPTGAAVTPQGAGETIAGGLERYIGPESRQRVSDLYDAVDAKIAAANPNSLTALDKTRQVIGDIMARRVAAHLDGPGKAVDHVLDAVQSPGLTYDGVKDLRTSVGEMLKDGRLPADMSGGELKQIYGGLSGDLAQSVSNSGGAPAAAAFARANRYAGLVADRRKVLDGLLGSRSGESLTATIQRMAGSNSSADASLLWKARRSVAPNEWNELSSAVVGQLGKNRMGEFSPDVFLSDYGKLSQAGKTALFNSTPGMAGLQSALDDIATVSGRFKQLQKFGNSSGTTQTAAGLGEIGAGAAALQSGSVMMPLGVLAGLVGAHATSRWLANPMSAKAIAKWSRAYAAASATPTPSNVSFFKAMTNNLISTAGGLYDTRGNSELRIPLKRNQATAP